MKKENIKSGVYFIKNDYNNQIKIGCTNDVDKRLEGLKREMFHLGFEFELTLLGAIYCENYYEVESSLHIEYKDRRKIGEWFDISEEEALNSIGCHNEEQFEGKVLFDEITSDEYIIKMGVPLYRDTYKNLKKCNLTISEIGLLSYLFEIGNYENTFEVSMEYMVEIMDNSERNIRKYLSKFSKLGILSYETLLGVLTFNISDLILRKYKGVM